MSGDLKVRPLTEELWPAFADLFDTKGPVGRCWCMYWRIGARYRTRDPAENRKSFREVIAAEPAPGLLVLDGDLAVGWCQVTPKPDLDRLDRDPKLHVDDESVWAISCFYIRKGHRRQGVATKLAVAAIEFAREAGGTLVEAYPVDASVSSTSSFTGFVTMFEQLGFAVAARHVDSRPVMRLAL
jgi:GNAT superfamily N-acetyltransferase